MSLSFVPSLCYTFGLDSNYINSNNLINSNIFDISNIKGDIGNAIGLCETSAINKNKNFFFVGDLSYNSTNYQDNNLNCYIPKNEYRFSVNECNPNGKFNFLHPITEFISGIFGTENNASNNFETITNTISGNCLKFNDYKIGTNDHYVLYQKRFSENINLDYINNDNYIEDKKNQFNIIFNYDNFNSILSDISTSFNSYICSTSNNLSFYNDLSGNIDNLLRFYINCNNYLDQLRTDISNIFPATDYKKIRLRDLEDNITNKQNELKNILGLDSGNNGKFNDALFMKNLKIGEITILILIIISCIFIYSKKK
jgi:hypothetical protein